MADNSTLPATGEVIATDELTSINGAPTSGIKVQRVKTGFGSDGDLKDVSATQGLPITSTPAEDPLGLPTYDDTVASLIAGNSISQDQRSLLDVLDPLSDDYVAPQAEVIGSAGLVVAQDPTSGAWLMAPTNRRFRGFAQNSIGAILASGYCGDMNYIAFMMATTSATTVTVEALMPDGTWTGMMTQFGGAGTAMTQSTAPGSGGTANLFVWGHLTGAEQFRIRYTSGSGAVRISGVLTNAPPLSMGPAGQLVAANLQCTNTPLAPTAATNLNSAATTNATSVKASAGRITSLVATNNGAAVCFLKLYNKASAPTVGTDTPTLVISIPANGVPVTVDCGALGLQFSTGIAYAITNLIGDADTTAIAAGQVKLMMSYV